MFLSNQDNFTEFIHQNPPPNAFLVPHSLSLADNLDYLYLADRENGRILCFFASNGTFHREYKNPSFGTKVYSIAHSQEKLYLVNGPDPFQRTFHVRGFIIDTRSGNILSQFGPNQDMDMPHDIAVNGDGSEIYVGELNTRKVYKFTQGKTVLV